MTEPIPDNQSECYYDNSKGYIHTYILLLIVLFIRHRPITDVFVRWLIIGLLLWCRVSFYQDSNTVLAV